MNKEQRSHKKKVLILFAHPALERSRIHHRLLQKARQVEGVYVHDLYQKYPDFNIDVAAEQKLLKEHDLILWQHPFYWYSAPPLLKHWIDLVLEQGWAYGKGGDQLAGKQIFNCISCGGSEAAYQPEGRNRFTIRQLLAPFDQTAYLCKMSYLPPFVVYGGYNLSTEDLDIQALQYEQLLLGFTTGRFSEDEWRTLSALNGLCPLPKSMES